MLCHKGLTPTTPPPSLLQEPGDLRAGSSGQVPSLRQVRASNATLRPVPTISATPASAPKATFSRMAVDITGLIQLLMGLTICLYITSLVYPLTDFPFGIPFSNLLHGRKPKVPVSVNYHFTRRCNKTCGFCFHTATTSLIEDLPIQKRALRLLAQSGMRKINFAGGEPFLYPKPLGAMVDYCKRELGLESVSIVTNGSLVKESFLRQHAGQLDILAVSCDSFDEQTNIAIGRGSGDQVKKLYEIAGWCRRYGVMFKINTVVNKLNVAEDMNEHIAVLQPFRWKCFSGADRAGGERLRGDAAERAQVYDWGQRV